MFFLATIFLHCVICSISRRKCKDLLSNTCLFFMTNFKSFYAKPKFDLVQCSCPSNLEFARNTQFSNKVDLLSPSCVDFSKNVLKADSNHMKTKIVPDSVFTLRPHFMMVSPLPSSTRSG